MIEEFILRYKELDERYQYIVKQFIQHMEGKKNNITHIKYDQIEKENKISRIKEVMKEKGITRGKLHIKTNIPESTIKSIIYRGWGNTSNNEKIMQALNVEENEIFIKVPRTNEEIVAEKNRLFIEKIDEHNKIISKIEFLFSNLSEKNQKAVLNLVTNLKVYTPDVFKDMQGSIQEDECFFNL